MKRRVRVLSLLLAMVMVIGSGCQSGSGGEGSNGSAGKAGESTEVSPEESEEYLSWIRQALSEFEQQEKHETVIEYVSQMDDGSEESYATKEIIDKSREMACTIYEEEDYEATDYYTVEDGVEYWYTETYFLDEDAEELEIQTCRIPYPEDEYTEQWFYSDFINNSVANVFETDDSTEYQNVVVSNAGEEEIDGVKVVRLVVDYESRSNSVEVPDRESVLAENEFTEENIALIEGMSEAIDAYVEETAALAAKEGEFKKHQTIYYLTAEDHKIVKSEYSEDVETNETPAADAFMEYQEMYYILAEDLEEGYSIEEALADIEEQMSGEYYDDEELELEYDGEDETELEYDGEEPEDGEYAEDDEYMEDGEYWDEGEMDEMAEVISYTSYTTYLTGDDCDAISDVPEDAVDMTMDEYMG